jgi:hypothetical protein
MASGCIGARMPKAIAYAKSPGVRRLHRTNCLCSPTIGLVRRKIDRDVRRPSAQLRGNGINSGAASTG